MLGSISFCDIYRAKAAHFSLNLAFVKYQIHHSVFVNAKNIQTDKTTPLMITFFPVRSELSLNWTLQIFCSIHKEKKKLKSSMEYFLSS